MIRFCHSHFLPFRPRKSQAALLEDLRKIVAGHLLVDSTNFHVRFNDFGESSLNILLIFYLKTDEFGLELKYREEILLQIIELVPRIGFDFAFPTRTLHLETRDLIPKFVQS